VTPRKRPTANINPQPAKPPGRPGEKRQAPTPGPQREGKSCCGVPRSPPRATYPTARHITDCPVHAWAIPSGSARSSMPTAVSSPGGDAFRDFRGQRKRWHPLASGSTCRPSTQSPVAWSGCSNSVACKVGSWSMPPSWRGDSGSSAPGSTPTRSSWVRSSSAMGQSRGFDSIRRSQRRSCGRLAQDRRLTRPPARVSGRASRRGVEGPRFGCCRCKGRTARHQWLR
jgi:hypothetical protein